MSLLTLLIITFNCCPAGTLLRAEFKSSIRDLRCNSISSADKILPCETTFDLSDRKSRDGDSTFTDSILLKHPSKISCMQKGVDGDIKKKKRESQVVDNNSKILGDRFRLLRSKAAGVLNLALNEDSVVSSPFTFPSSLEVTPFDSSPAVLIAQYYPSESVCTENIDTWLKFIPDTSHTSQSGRYSKEANNSHEKAEIKLSSLISRDWILFSPWHSLSIQLYSLYSSTSNTGRIGRKSITRKRDIVGIGKGNIDANTDTNTTSSQKSNHHEKVVNTSHLNKYGSGSSSADSVSGNIGNIESSNDSTIDSSSSSSSSSLHRAKQKLSMMLTVSAVLLPDILPIHADILRILMERMRFDMDDNGRDTEGPTLQSSSSSSSHTSSSSSSTYTSSSSGLPSSSPLTSTHFPSKASYAPVHSFSMDYIDLSREIRDSREREFFMVMAVTDNFNYTDVTHSAEVFDELPSPSPRQQRGYNGGIKNCDCLGGGSCVNGCDTNSNNGSECGNGSRNHNFRVHVVELITPFYDILLHTYTYTISDEPHSNFTSDSVRYVADLPSFLYTPVGKTDRDCYPRDYPPGSILPGVSSTSAPDSSLVDSHPCFGRVSWSINLPERGTMRSSYTAIKRILHREQYPSDASRGLTVPPTFVTLSLSPPLSQATCTPTTTSSSSLSSSSTSPSTCSCEFLPSSTTSGSVGNDCNGSSFGPKISSKFCTHRLLTSEAVLITMPILDSSMPFNIITLVSWIASQSVSQ